MNCSGKFFDPIVTFLPLLAGSFSISEPDWPPPPPLVSALLLSPPPPLSSSLPQAATPSASTSTDNSANRARNVFLLIGLHPPESWQGKTSAGGLRFGDLQALGGDRALDGADPQADPERDQRDDDRRPDFAGQAVVLRGDDREPERIDVAERRNRRGGHYRHRRQPQAAEHRGQRQRHFDLADDLRLGHADAPRGVDGLGV